MNHAEDSGKSQEGLSKGVTWSDLCARIIHLVIRGRMAWRGPECMRADHLGDCCSNRQVTTLA